LESIQIGEFLSGAVVDDHIRHPIPDHRFRNIVETDLKNFNVRLREWKRNFAP
jgi:hypothetical protein